MMTIYKQRYFTVQVRTAKFGGSSLASPEQFKKVYDIVMADPTRRYVVASAPGKRFPEDTKVTDMLYACYDMAVAGLDFELFFDGIRARFDEIIAGLGLDLDLSLEYESIKESFRHGSGRDYAASRGEYLNSLILARYLGYDFIDAAEVVFFSEDGSLDEEITYKTLASALRMHERAVVPGFYGSMPNYTVRTFSRGGSDISGSIVARASGSDIYENWTDVSGFLMADPKIVREPLGIKVVTYRELRELSYMGAGVLHEDSVFPVRSAGIPIIIKNTNRPDDEGTTIVAGTDIYDREHIITGVAGKKNFSVIRIDKDRMAYRRGMLHRIVEILDYNGVHAEHIPSGIDTMSIVAHTEQLTGKYDILIDSIRRAVDPDYIGIEDGLALIAVVGRSMVGSPGVAARVFDALAKASINVRMIDQGACEINIIVGVAAEDFEDSVRVIYHEFVRR